MNNQTAAFLPKEFDLNRLVNLPTFRVGVTASDALVGKNSLSPHIVEKAQPGLWRVSSLPADGRDAFRGRKLPGVQTMSDSQLQCLLREK
jgi:hypothetical protein